MAGQHHLPLNGVLQAGGQGGGVHRGGHLWEGQLWVRAADSGDEHRQHVCLEGESNKCMVQKEQVKHMVQEGTIMVAVISPSL